MKTPIPKNIDDYIINFPVDIQKKLEQIRKTIKKAAPNAEEAIKYAMPTFTLAGNLVYFAAYKKHIGFYPVPLGDTSFNKEISIYQTTKGTLQFPLDKPLPLDLISRIVKLRVSENLQKNAMKKSKT